MYLNTKFDNNRSITFRDYLSNKNPGRQTDRRADEQTDGNGRPISSYSRCHETSRKHKIANHSIDNYNISLACAREVKVEMLGNSFFFPVKNV